MHDVIKNNPATSVKMVFMEDGSLDMRRYNTPTTRAEVAAIFVGDDGETPANRDIIIYPVGSSCTKQFPQSTSVLIPWYTLYYFLVGTLDGTAVWSMWKKGKHPEEHELPNCNFMHVVLLFARDSPYFMQVRNYSNNTLLMHM
ncbi:hypothetical protein JTE90_001654 [Oedothorax gibbosus]|uniref:Uncharacterized protein n=1 Tax=Oedothorax gibbosus TaxID=931172 RepID=A0AAV6UTT0_9ARAC|nr:hypothetical protein JTE90_001654 [Oedothorax gibbosus]